MCIQALSHFFTLLQNARVHNREACSSTCLLLVQLACSHSLSDDTVGAVVLQLLALLVGAHMRRSRSLHVLRVGCVCL